jgi:sterol desaturase/sphingolipid hydroxylase (fatty acid hydroxylase superfamily)
VHHSALAVEAVPSSYNAPGATILIQVIMVVIRDVFGWQDLFILYFEFFGW